MQFNIIIIYTLVDMKEGIIAANASLMANVELGRQPTLKILAVDDDVMSLQLFSALLLKIGYTCTVAKNGQEAIDLVLKEPFDIIFMDMHMPIVDGLEATRQIRSIVQAPKVPVIIGLTASSFAEDRERCLAAGMNDFMTKPYKILSMQELLSKWMKV